MLLLSLLSCRGVWYTFLPDGHEPSPACDEAGDFESVGQPFFLSWCSSCHSASVDTSTWGAPDEVELDTLAGIQSHAERSAARIAEGTMPPAGGPSEAEIEAVLAWLDCGAPGLPNPLPEGDASSDWTRTEGLSSGAVEADFPEGLTLRLESELGDFELVERWLVAEDEAWLVERELRIDEELWLQVFEPPLQLAGPEAFTQEVEQFVEGPEGSLLLEQSWEIEPVEALEARTNANSWQLAVADDGELMELGFTGSSGFGFASLEHSGFPQLLLWSSSDPGPLPEALLSTEGSLVVGVLWR